MAVHWLPIFSHPSVRNVLHFPHFNSWTNWPIFTNIFKWRLCNWRITQCHTSDFKQWGIIRWRTRELLRWGRHQHHLQLRHDMMAGINLGKMCCYCCGNIIALYMCVCKLAQHNNLFHRGKNYCVCGHIFCRYLMHVWCFILSKAATCPNLVLRRIQQNIFVTDSCLVFFLPVRCWCFYRGAVATVRSAKWMELTVTRLIIAISVGYSSKILLQFYRNFTVKSEANSCVDFCNKKKFWK